MDRCGWRNPNPNALGYGFRHPHRSTCQSTSIHISIRQLFQLSGFGVAPWHPLGRRALGHFDTDPPQLPPGSTPEPRLPEKFIRDRAGGGGGDTKGHIFVLVKVGVPPGDRVWGRDFSPGSRPAVAGRFPPFGLIGSERIFSLLLVECGGPKRMPFGAPRTPLGTAGAARPNVKSAGHRGPIPRNT